MPTASSQKAATKAANSKSKKKVMQQPQSAKRALSRNASIAKPAGTDLSQSMRGMLLAAGRTLDCQVKRCPEQVKAGDAQRRMVHEKLAEIQQKHKGDPKAVKAAASALMKKLQDSDTTRAMLECSASACAAEVAEQLNTMVRYLRASCDHLTEKVASGTLDKSELRQKKESMQATCAKSAHAGRSVGDKNKSTTPPAVLIAGLRNISNK